MKKRIVFLGAVLALLLVVSAASAENEVYFSQQPVYIPECGNATVDILMNASDSIDTWSTMVEFDSECVNITEVNFTGSITQANASGHHGDYIYLGGTGLTAMSGNELLLATLTVECNGSGVCTSHLNFTGEYNVTRLIAGPPDDTPPRNGTIYSATWVNGSAKSVGCGDVTGDGNVNWFDYVTLRAYVLGAHGWTVRSNWTADVTGDGNVNWFDYVTLRAYVLGAPGWELNCSCG